MCALFFVYVVPIRKSKILLKIAIHKKNKHIYLSIEATNKLTTYIKTQKGRIPSLQYAVYCSSYVVDFIERSFQKPERHTSQIIIFCPMFITCLHKSNFILHYKINTFIYQQMSNAKAKLFFSEISHGHENFVLVLLTNGPNLNLQLHLS